MMTMHCIRCGSVLQKENEHLFTCPSCGFHHYRNPKPTNAVILLNKNNDVLLYQRAVEPKKGSWDLPGGFVDLGENLEESVTRELQEELGVKITKMTYFKSYKDRYDYQEVNYHTLVMVFVAQLEEEIKKTAEIPDARFFPLSDIPFSNIGFISTDQALRDFLTSPYNPSRAV